MIRPGDEVIVAGLSSCVASDFCSYLWNLKVHCVVLLCVNRRIRELTQEFYKLRRPASYILGDVLYCDYKRHADTHMLQ